ncbi:HNH endonuclease [Streptomyces parvus]|uniref:HNH endonuclease n=1 Tax=Streptomyces parvus TaxID=66428 RepID=UPI0033C4F8C6
MWGYRCAYCGESAEHLDHVMPLSRGGTDTEDNMVPACAKCNLSKGAKTLEEWRGDPTPPTPF